MSVPNVTGDLVPFAYGATTVRTITIDGEPWFVLADLCAVLGLTTPSRVAERVDPAGVSQTHISSSGQRRSFTIVNEPNMYEVVIRSDKPEAAAFRRWITGTVLPEIRRTGSYSTAPALTDDELIHRALTISTQRVASLTAQVAELEPRAAVADELINADGLYTLQAAAKAMHWGPNIIFRDLRRLGILQGNNLPYQRYAHHFEVKLGTRQHPKTGETIPTTRTYVKPSALPFLRKKLHGVDAPVQLELNGAQA